MQNLYNRIGSIWLIKSVAIFSVIFAMFVFSIFLLMVIYGFEGSLFRAIHNGFWVLLMIAAAYVFVAINLFKKKKTGLYAGLLLFCAMICVLSNMATAVLGEEEYIDFRSFYAILAIINVPFLLFLLVGWRKYFEMVGKGKNIDAC